MYNEEFELVNFICTKCGENLVQALPSSRVLCKKCNYWVEQQAKEETVYDASIRKYSMSVVCK